MMKTVYFVRHAKSSWKDATLADIDRPLNKRGRRDAPFMGKQLRDKGVKPDLLVSSPALRAFTTARHFAAVFGLEDDAIRIVPLIYHAFPDDLVDLVRSLPAEAQTVFIFGHNPTYTSLANQFAVDFIDNVPTCGVFRIDAGIDNWENFGPDNGRLTAFYFPKQFQK